MNRINYFHENYVQPVFDNKIVIELARRAFVIIAEIVKIVAAKMFLQFITKQFLFNNSKISAETAIITCIIAPVLEEIVFRGVLLKGIHLIQITWNYCKKNDLTKEDELGQQIFRVRLSSLVFAAAHLLNPHKNLIAAGIQFTWALLLGSNCGYLTEKYHTLSIGILIHGFNNSIAIGAEVYSEQYAPLFLLAIAVNALIADVLVETNIASYITSTMSNTLSSCYSFSTESHSIREFPEPPDDFEELVHIT